MYQCAEAPLQTEEGDFWNDSHSRVADCEVEEERAEEEAVAVVQSTGGGGGDRIFFMVPRRQTLI